MAKKESQETPEVQAQTAPETPVEEKAPEVDPCEALKKDLAAERELRLRQAAEYDNYRKRSQKEREALFTEVRADTISKLLPVYDNLDRALRQPTADEAYRKGVEMTMQQLTDILEKMNVTLIPALGEKFDPTFHNAVMHVDDETLGEGIVAEVFQEGFRLGEKVIRFSMVKVAN